MRGFEASLAVPGGDVWAADLQPGRSSSRHTHTCRMLHLKVRFVLRVSRFQFPLLNGWCEFGSTTVRVRQAILEGILMLEPPVL